MPDQSTSTPAADGTTGKPDYGAAYYEHDCGIPYERNEHWLGFFDTVAANLVRTLRPTSSLDAGCAWGFLVEALHSRGVDAYGLDVSDYGISKVDESVADRCRVASLVEPLPRRYDLITCIEVIEHIPPEETATVIANLCSATDRILLSTSPGDYGEPTHLNVQPPEYWSATLAQEGFIRNLDLDFSFLTPWAALYERTDEPRAETVRSYDRAWWRARKEAAEVREALLRNQEALAAAREFADVGALRQAEEERDRDREQNLHLRDLLVGKDAELGAARGAAAAAAYSTRTVTGVMGRIQAKIPSQMRRLGGILRRLQGR
jgi:hypothetical protein